VTGNVLSVTRASPFQSLSPNPEVTDETAQFGCQTLRMSPPPMGISRSILLTITYWLTVSTNTLTPLIYSCRLFDRITYIRPRWRCGQLRITNVLLLHPVSLVYNLKPSFQQNYCLLRDRFAKRLANLSSAVFVFVAEVAAV
jgi:hypothetical protein